MQATEMKLPASPPILLQTMEVSMFSIDPEMRATSQGHLIWVHFEIPLLIHS